jgi:hypothetical protein
VVLSGGILVLPKEDLDFEASLRVPGELGCKSTTEGDPAALGVVLIPSPKSKRERTEASETIEKARQLIQADLDRHVLCWRSHLVTRSGAPAY